MKLLNSRLRVGIALALLIIGGAILRFFTWPWMGFSGDETWTLRWAAQPVREIMSHLDVGLTMHLYILLIKAWSKLVGISPHAWKLPSLIAGVLAIPILYALARRHTGRPIALLASLLLTVSLAAIHFSRVARVYALLTIVAMVGMALFHRVLTRGGLRSALLLSVVNGISLMLSPNAAYLLLVQGLSTLLETLFIKRADSQRLLLLGLTFAGSVTLALIFYVGLLDQILPAGAQYSGGSNRGLGLLCSIFRVIHPIAAGPMALLILVGSFGSWRTGPGARLIVLWAWVPLLFLAFIGTNHLPVIALGRYVVTTLPAHFLLAATGAWGLAGRISHPGRSYVAAALLLVPLTLTALLQPDAVKTNFQEPTSSHETFRSLASQVAREDLVAADPDYQRWVMMLYVTNDRPSLAELCGAYDIRNEQRLFIIADRADRAEAIWRECFSVEVPRRPNYEEPLVILKSRPLRDRADLHRVVACYLRGALAAWTSDPDPIIAMRRQFIHNEYQRLLALLHEPPPVL